MFLSPEFLAGEEKAPEGGLRRTRTMVESRRFV